MSETILRIKKQIAGEKLSAVTFVLDYVQLNFGGPGFTVLTPITVSSSSERSMSGGDQFRNRLCDQIGKTVADVFFEGHQSLLISFSDGTSIALSLRPEDYPGPEAVIFNGNENLWAVF